MPAGVVKFEGVCLLTIYSTTPPAMRAPLLYEGGEFFLLFYPPRGMFASRITRCHF
jgi:hypothetical protein